MATYIKQSKLEWSDLWTYFGMSKDNGGRWFPTDETPDYVHEFLEDYRTPSRHWPYSYAKAMLTQKFAKLVIEKDPELAIKLGVAE